MSCFCHPNNILYHNFSRHVLAKFSANMILDVSFGIVACFGAKKIFDFNEAFNEFEKEAERLTREGKRSEIFKCAEFLVIKKMADQTESEFHEEMKNARVETAKILLRCVEARSAERRAKRRRKA